jgi:hypothetical protein
MKRAVFLSALAALLFIDSQPFRVFAGDPVLKVSERTTKPLLKADQPWEDFCLSYCQVLRVGERWHMWYNARDRDYRGLGDSLWCYARSADGVRWEKPALRIVDHRGSKQNNILLVGYNVGSVFVDAAAEPARRFKAVATHSVRGEPAVYGGTSPDGIQWAWGERPLFKGISDTANVGFRDRDTYRLYVRRWTMPPYGGRRQVGYTESKVFGQFPEPTIILTPDAMDPGDLHFYNSAASQLKDRQYLMFPSGLTTGDGSVRVYAAFSQDGKTFKRLGRQPVLAIGSGFDAKGLYVAPGGVPAERPNTYWFYYLGTRVAHDDNRPSHVKSDGGIGRFLVHIAE